MCAMKIVSVGTDAKGNINIEELRKAAETHKDNLAALMVQLALLPIFEFYLHYLDNLEFGGKGCFRLGHFFFKYSFLVVLI